MGERWSVYGWKLLWPGFVVLLLSLFFVHAAHAQSDAKGSNTKKGPQATVSSNGNPARGRVVYQRHCAVCHHATSSAKKIGRGLKGIYKAGKFADGKPVTDKSMRLWIEDGGKDMPQFKNTLRPAQIADLIAYIRTI